MKNLIKNIWQAPAATIAGGITASIGVVIAADIELSKVAMITMLSLSAFLSVFSGPNPKK